MFVTYDLRLAVQSLQRHKGLSALMVLAIALGIAVCTMTFTIYHAMATNPIEWKNDQLYAVTMDNWDPREAYNDDEPEMPPTLMTYRDTNKLHASDIPKRSVIMYKSGAVLDSGRKGAKAERAMLRVTTGEFFPMFDVPFQFGQGWSKAADEGPEPVIVLSHETNQEAFGGENSVGRTVLLGDAEFRVVGVLRPWSPSPKFYDLNNGTFEDSEDAYIPYRWGEIRELPVYGNTNCWKSDPIASYADFLNSECVWIQMWAELPTTADRDRFQSYIDNYARQQKEAGRFPRPVNNRLINVGQWLDANHVVKKDNRVLIGIALLFLGVCLVNVVGLLLAKFLNNAAMTGLRRALGASRRDIVRQHLAEVLLLGAAGGALGIVMAMVGLRGIRGLYDFEADAASWERLTSIDFTVVLVTFGLSLLASALAGLYPAWRIGRTTPAIYLKTQ